MPTRPHVLAIFVRDGVRPAELGLAHQIFGQARSADGCHTYNVVTCTAQPGSVHSDADFTISAYQSSEVFAAADTVLFTAAASQDLGRKPVSRRLIAAIERIRPGTRIASICTASFLLAEAGLLTGRRAVAHRHSADLFRSYYPDVPLDPDVSYTEDSGVLTSSDQASGMDMCRLLVRRDQLSQPVVPPDSLVIRTIQMWALSRIHQPLTVRDLAHHASLSVRTFTRQFRAHVGQSPLQWLNQERVKRAQRLLEETDHKVDHIAAQVGLGTGTNLRTQFARHAHVSPTTYRAAYRAWIQQ